MQRRANRRPKKNRGRKGGSLGGNRQGSLSVGRSMLNTVRTPCTWLAAATFAASSTAQYFTLLQNVGSFLPRIVDMMDNYQLYRVTSLKLTFMTVGTGSVGFALGYSTATGDSIPSGATLNTVTQLGSNVFIPPLKDSNTVLHVPRSQLLSTIDKWHASNRSGVLADYQGNVVIVPTASYTGTVYVRFDVVVDFKSPTISVTTSDRIVDLEKKLVTLKKISNAEPKFVSYDEMKYQLSYN